VIFLSEPFPSMLSGVILRVIFRSMSDGPCIINVGGGVGEGKYLSIGGRGEGEGEGLTGKSSTFPLLLYSLLVLAGYF
jgi:hypothetical protein